MKKNIIIKNLFLLIFLLPLITRAQNEKFDDFIKLFAQDSIFQISRIEFPLKYLSWDYEKDKEYETAISKEKYKFDNLYFYLLDCGQDAFPIFYDNFECKFGDTGEMVFRWIGFTDVDRRYYFKRINGIWFLVKILDYDPLE